MEAPASIYGAQAAAIALMPSHRSCAARCGQAKARRCRGRPDSTAAQARALVMGGAGQSGGGRRSAESLVAGGRAAAAASSVRAAAPKG